MKKCFVYFLPIIFIISSCQTTKVESNSLRIATTTSLENSGLLSFIIPIFEDEYNVEAEVIAVGTGQALALGERGDVDLVLVHAPFQEINFVESGFGLQRYVIMFNDFVILGPIDDPAKISELTFSREAFINIYESNSIFISRGDQSGTHYKENEIWSETFLDPDNHGDWYNSVGQGMGASLQLANEKEAYILADRGTYLAQKANLLNLIILFGGFSSDNNPDNLMKNIYSVIPINPEKYPNINFTHSKLFIEWISSVRIQKIIGEFGLEDFGIPLFYPNSEEWNSKNSFNILTTENNEIKVFPG